MRQQGRVPSGRSEPENRIGQERFAMRDTCTIQCWKFHESEASRDKSVTI